MDRFSALPDEIIHLIMARLYSDPLYSKGAAKLAVLSKRWMNLWLSYPILEIDGECTEKGFLASITKKFSPCCSNLNLQEIRVSFNYFEHGPSAYPNFLPDALAMISSGEPEKIDIEAYYDYSITVAPLITNRRLRILKLRGCKLGRLSTYKFGMIINLRELHLSDYSSDDDTLNRLIASAPSLETLKLDIPKLGVHKRLQICNNPKLKYIVFNNCRADDLIQIKGAHSLDTLEFFCSTDVNPHFEISTSPTSTLRLLKIRHHCSRKTLSVDKLISAIPCLEELYLSDIYEVTKLNIINPTLRRVTMNNNNYPTRYKFRPVSYTVRIDAPELVRLCCYESMGFLPLFSFATDLQASASFIGRLSSRNGVIMTHKVSAELKYFLSSLSKQFRTVEISFLSLPAVQHAFGWDQIRDGSSAVVIHQLYYFGTDLLDLHKMSVIFDGLFWACHPKYVSVLRRTGDLDQDWSSCLEMVYKLFTQQWCGWLAVSCKRWTRKLKDIETFYLKEDSETGKLFFIPVSSDRMKEHKVIQFKLMWYEN